jgi:amino acid adenylation domain-containing protein
MNHFPLTHIQKGILFHIISENKSSCLYLVQTKVYIKGLVQVSLLKKAWNIVIRKHPALRVQLTHDLESLETVTISEQVNANFQLQDLSKTSDKEIKITRLLEKDYQTPINLRCAPLMRYTMVRLNKKKHLLIWTYHHIILDGYSAIKILLEVFQCYELLLKNKSVDKKNNDNELVQLKSSLDKHHWKEFLSDFSLTTKLSLPIRETENRVFTFEEKKLNRDVYKNIKRWCKKNNVSISILVYTVWGILMRHYSQQKDVTFGVVRSLSRNKYKNKFGLLLNTLPIVIKLTKTTTNIDLIHHVTEQLNVIKQRTETPLSKLQAISYGRHVKTELFDTAVNIMSPTVSYISKRWRFEGIAISVETMNVRTHYAIMLDALVDPWSLSFRLNYQSDKLNRLLAKQILNQLSYLLEQITLQNKYVVDLPILLPNEKTLVLSSWNSTKNNLPQDKTLIGLFLTQCKQFKNKTAICSNGNHITYGEVDQLSNQLANYLICCGIKPGAVVGVLIERELSMIVSVLSILRAGARYLPLDPNYPKDRLAYIIEDSHCANIIASQTFHALYEDLSANKKGLTVLVYQQVIQKKMPISIDVNLSLSNSGMSVIYTSGSTGKPKGVCNTHIGALNRILWMKKKFHIQSTDKILHKTSFCFDVSVWEIFLPLISGAELILAPKGANEASDLLIQAIQKYKITILHFVPSLLKVFLLDDHLERCKSITQVFASGEVLSVTVINDFFSKLPWAKLYNLYGPTEASIDVTWWQCQPNTNLKRVPIGKPIDNTQCYVLGYDQKPVSPGIIGELYLGGIGLASEYINHLELTNERFLNLKLFNEVIQRVYKTGDWVCWRETGVLDYIGRKDQQIKLRGYRIELSEIVSSILDYPVIQDAIVLIKKTPAMQDCLVSYVQVKPKRHVNFNGIKIWLEKKLPVFMIPERWIVVDKFLTLPNGKVNLNALPEPEWGINQQSRLIEQKETSSSLVEQILERLWTEVLKIKSIKFDNNFFELGGDSILSIQICILARQYNLNIRPRDIFEHPTITELSNFINTKNVCNKRLTNYSKRVLVSAIQSDFLKFQNIHYIHYWHQIFPWKCKKPFNLELIKNAWNIVLSHHPIFFYTFHMHKQRWYMEKQKEVTFNIIEYEATSPISLKYIKAIEEKLNVFKHELNIEKGPLAKIILITYKKNVIYCYPIFHHLIIDIISWIILLKEMEMAYRNLLKGNQPALPKPTMPYLAWAGAVKPVKKKTGDAQNALIKIFQCLDFAENNIEENSCILHRQLVKSSYEKIKPILTYAKISIDTLILFVLDMAISEINSKVSIYIDVEKNGRDVFEQSHNYTSSIGWFTIIETVKLSNIDRKKSLIDQLLDFQAQLKQQLKSKKTNESIPFGSASICINNLGDFDQWNRSNQYFEMRYDPNVRTHHPKSKRFYWVEIETYIQGNKLHIDWRLPKLLSKNSNFQLLYRNFFVLFNRLLNTSELFPHSNLSSLTNKEHDTLKTIHERWEKESKIKIGAIQTIHPLNNTQQGILFHCLQQSTQGSYINQMVLTINGVLNQTTVRTALGTLFKSYDVLRSGIIFEGLDKASIAIFKNCDIPFLWKDLSKISLKDAEKYIHQYCQSIRQQEILLNLPILLRFACFKKASNVFVLVITYHHIILDGWSLSILIKDFILASQGKHTKKDGFSYGDYINYYKRLHISSAKNYWKSLLSKSFAADELIQLPKLGTSNDKACPYGQYICTLPKRMVKNLSDIAACLKATLSTLFQCAWAITLHFYTQKDDIVYGTTTSGRRIELHDIEKAVGVFIQTFPVALKIHSTTTVEALISLLQRQIAQSISFSHYSLNKIIAEKSTKAALFKTLLVYENYPDPIKVSHLLSVKLLSSFDPTHYPITIIIHPRETFQLCIQYQTSMYTKQQMMIMAQSFIEALKHTYLSTKETIDTLSLLPTKAYRKLIYDRNNTSSYYTHQLTLVELLTEQTNRTPKKIALVDKNSSLTYQQLEESTNQFAHYLNSVGITKGVCVIIKMARHIGYIQSIIAILKCGAAYIPLTSETPNDRVGEIIKNSQAKGIITDQRNLQIKESFQIIVLYFYQLLKETKHFSRRMINVENTPQSTCYITYTSGSTGVPKGVEITHQSVVNILFDMRKRFKDDLRFFILTDFTFDISNLEIFLPLLFGGMGLLIDIENFLTGKENVNQLIKKHDIKYIQSTPSILQKILQGNISNDITILSGGEKLSKELAAQILSRNMKLWNFYGPTETTIWSTAYQVLVNALRKANIPIGRPISNTGVYILDHRQRLVSEGVIGELYIGGDGVAKGYLNDVKQTKNNFVTVDLIPGQSKLRLYKTGDFAYWDRCGDLIFIGRRDEQIKINGIRVEVHEIESVLNTHPFVKKAVVLLSTLENNEKSLVAILLPNYKNIHTYLLSHKLEEKALSGWGKVYDDVYQNSINLASRSQQGQYDTTGWVSSYTNKPIPYQEMEDWVNQAVWQVDRFSPKRILEVGCGTGNILYKLANACEHYVGLDISITVIRKIQQSLKKLSAINKIELQPCSILQFEYQSRYFDIIILNSVIQYYPTREYLYKSLIRCMDFIQDGGHIFIGDVRRLELSELFYFSSLFSRANQHLTVAEFLTQMDRRKNTEKELLASPIFFYEFIKENDRITHIDIHLENSYYSNEMTEYRCNVILYIAHSKNKHQLKLHWEEFESFEKINHELSNTSRYLAIKGITNSLTLQLSSYLAQIQSTNKDTTLSSFNDFEMLKKQIKSERSQCVELAEKHGYSIRLIPSNTDNVLFDVLFYKKSDEDIYFASIHSREEILNKIAQSRDQASNTTNYPLFNARQPFIFNKIKSDISKKLIPVMVPTAFHIVDKIPLTSSGKINRKALSRLTSVINRTQLVSQYIAPISETEKKLAIIWKNILNQNRVGQLDNFFALGGHSLLALELLGKVYSTFNISIALSDIARCKNLLELSKYIDCKKDIGIAKTDSKRSNIILLNKKIEKHPDLFLIHPVGGTIFCYIPLATALSNKVNVYGIEDPDINRSKFKYQSISELASEYIHQIDLIHKGKPYFLGGLSLGGTIAIEMAAQLENKNDELCKGLFLLDTWSYMGDVILSKPYLQRAMQRQYKRLKLLLKTKKIPNPEQLFALNLNRMNMNKQCKPNYTLNKHPVFLFKAKQLSKEYKAIDSEHNYWEPYIKNLTTYQVSGNHETVVLPPNVSKLSDLILEIITKLQNKN